MLEIQRDLTVSDTISIGGTDGLEHEMRYRSDQLPSLAIIPTLQNRYDLR
jgi:hypothetical protein